MHSIYSTIYVKGNGNCPSELFGVICNLLPNYTQKYSMTVESDSIGITVNNNPDIFEGSEYEAFPLCLEVDSSGKKMNEYEYIEFLSNLLKSLWSMGISTITVSDFELELPHGGCWP